MGSFVRWYIDKLKTRPVATNLVSSLVLMVVGDMAAQEMERHHMGDKPELENVPLKRRLSLRPYGTQPDISLGHAQLTDAQSSGKHDQGGWRGTLSRGSTRDFALLWNDVKSQVEHLDGIRTATMAGWSVMFMTPFWLTVYRFFDWVFPVQTPFTVAARVAGSLVASVPINAMFFVYGTSVHHTIEWLSLCSESQLGFESSSSGLGTTMSDGPPFDMEMMLSKSELKVRTELYNTMAASVKAWVPINVVNFALVPSHLRPLVLALCSAGWNCYLSLVQHRDMTLPEQ